MTKTTAPLTWRPTVDLPGGLHLRIADLHGPLDTGQVRTSLLDG